MSVLVAFLLIYTADVEIVQNTQGRRDSAVDARKTQAQQSVVVMITKDHVFVQGELVADVADVNASSEPLVEPLRRVLDRPMVAGQRRRRGNGDSRSHGDRRQVAAVRSGAQGHGDLHGDHVREDLARSAAEIGSHR